MSKSDQCPSTAKEGPKQQKNKQELSRERRSLLTAVNGRAAWRSLEEVEDTSEFRDFLEREFPAGVTDFLSGTRRTFMKIMGASFALAGAATLPGCRRPDHKILPYSQHPPEDVIPGKPLFYATSMPLPGGGSEGLLVETHEGRPTKLEGNPLHPVNRGRSSVAAQASVLSLYDPDRLKEPVFFNRMRNSGAGEHLPATWDDFVKWGKEYFPRFDKTQGAGLAIIVDKVGGPSRDAVRDALLKKWPKATWIAYDATEDLGPAQGAKAAFGAPMIDVIDFSKAKVVVSFDRDFLTGEGRSLVHARDFASTRRVEELTDEMSRLYMFESGFCLTGAQADHRLRATPSKVLACLVELAKFTLPKLGGGFNAASDALAGIATASVTDTDRKFIEEAAKDLLDPAKKGRTMVLVGAHLPAPAHAIAHAINAALGCTCIGFNPMPAELAADSRSAMIALTEAMKAGKYESVLCVGTNPAFTAPDSTAFAEAFAKLEGGVSLSVGKTETSEFASWNLNGCHYLESWGDTVSHEGVIAPIQPMIAPLYAAADENGHRTGQSPMSEIEFLAFISGDLREDGTPRDGYEIVRRTWKGALGAKVTDFEKAWKRALHDGVVAGTGFKPASPKADVGAIAASCKGFKIEQPAPGTLEGVIRTGWMHDGRNTNISWLQELPQHGTAVVWDNPVSMSPRTAERLGVLPANATVEDPETMYTKQKYPAGHVAEFTFNGRTVRCACWILPGMADDTVIFLNGYGRRKAGLVADGVGFDVGQIRGGSGNWLASVSCKDTGEMHPIASTQMHWSLEGRTAIVRSVDLPTYQKFGGDAIPDNDTIYARNSSGKLNFAERLGELSHTPPNNSIYINPFTRSAADVDPNDPGYLAVGGWSDKLRSKDPQPPDFAQRHQWGMTIDLSTCTGCGACTIACQAENNIPVVGKKEVAKGREMHWIRVDRYFAGSYFDHENPGKMDYNAPEFMLHQPVACVQCENAPCETVCPVNATVHGNEGHNFMTYNRCIGTRYCANNCPYKVRRFNFFEYGLTKFNGGYIGQELVDSIAPDRGGITGSGEHNKINPNLIPPRLRDKLDQITRMQKNPDVTTRMRGIMEKCTYCIQRTNSAKIEVRLQDIEWVPDGFVQVACQQACPSDSIVFGDILDLNTEYTEADGGKRKGSRVYHTRRSRRSYLLLGFLNTRPRTSHLLRVNNPNPALVDATRKAAWDHPFHGSHDAGHGDGHGADHGHEGDHSAPKEKGHSFFDPRKKSDDKGYALSLSVLSGGGLA
ncbi:MAG: TAT-variant-translocated molybdopterin oxidoreductase [Planctomycetes bacterium]|nr:TAT-variant-translocated molybdopterin oxidoreductase [Planctomycetota bacterium]